MLEPGDLRADADWGAHYWKRDLVHEVAQPSVGLAEWQGRPYCKVDHRHNVAASRPFRVYAVVQPFEQGKAASRVEGTRHAEGAADKSRGAVEEGCLQESKSFSHNVAVIPAPRPEKPTVDHAQENLSSVTRRQETRT
jgi:hypothetical protein